jgi:hypothetical protein
MLAGGLLALNLAWVGFLVIAACLSIATGCLGLSILVALPAITGVVSILGAVWVYLRPSSHLVAGGAVVGISAATIAIGLVLFLPDPAALGFVLALFAWPVILTLIGGGLALAWTPGPPPQGWTWVPAAR